MGKEFIRLNKEGMIDMTQFQKSNYWRWIKEYKSAERQQQGLVVPKPDSANPSKPFILYKYNNWM